MSRNDFIIITDSDGELPLSIQKEYSVPYVPMPYVIDGQEYFYDLGENTDFKSFFSKVRSGSIPSTSTYPPSYYVDLFTPYLEKGTDILFISFSSRLSSAFSYILNAKQQLSEVYPERRIEAVDTHSISGGMALLVYEALKMARAGKSMDEIIQWLEDNKHRANAWFTVDDLNHLKRGGRISPAVAAIGSILNIKPVLNINREGAIVSNEKARGRKAAIRMLSEITLQRAENPGESVLIILHADCEEDALQLRSQVEAKMQFKEVFFQYVGPVIGAHAGPDTLGICFMGKEND